MLYGQDIARKEVGLERRRKAVEDQIRSLQAEFNAEESEALKAIEADKARIERLIKDTRRMAKSRSSDVDTAVIGPTRKKARAQRTER